MPVHDFDPIEQEPYDLSSLEIHKATVYRNLPIPVLYEEALRYEHGSAIADSGALVVSSNKYTGRVPKEKRVVKDELTEDNVQWGSINIPVDNHVFHINRMRALDYLNSRTRLYVVDGFAGYDPKYRIKVRIVCSRAYHALFMRNMLIRPTKKELESFGKPDYTILNAGAFPSNRYTTGITSDASVMINFKEQEMVILGTEYAGEMKKGVFSIMNYLMPHKGVLPMHCAANVDDNNNTTLFFGLSGTGKTTLSSDYSKRLVGDDEHCWTDNGIFNIEGGCYAKCINPPEDIKECIYFGALLENVVYDHLKREVDYDDETLTTNTRSAYPIDHVKNCLVPGIAPHPQNIVFLTCDAFGVLPPVSRLNSEQAMYHFISGYTAKTPNTEVGVSDPTATFSACFGEVFLPLNPTIYAEMLAKKMKEHNAKVWLVNTGWIGGDFHTGKRISLKDTRTIITSICSGNIQESSFKKDPLFGFDVCTSCVGVETKLDPRESWKDQNAYESKAKTLVNMFHENIKKYDSSSFINGGPIRV